MKQFVLIAAVLLQSLFLITADAQKRPRFPDKGSSVNPQISISQPVSQPTDTVSAAAYTVGGTYANTESVTWTCPECGIASGSATLASGSFSFSVTLACSSGAGSTNVITATATGSPAKSDSLTVTCITPDSADPIVAISTNNGADYSTSTPAVTLAGTSSDDVLVETVTMTSATTTPTTVVATFLGNGNIAWEVPFVLAPGPNIITVTALDQEGNDGTDTITITYTPPVRITSPVNLGTCVEDTACSLLTTITATDGTTPYTWTQVGSNLNTGNCTGINGADSGNNFAFSSTTPNPASVPVTCSFTLNVEDATAGEDEQTFNILIVSASAEDFDDYFEAQIAARSACTTTTDEDCIVQISGVGGAAACPHGTYGDKGACTLRAQAQLNALGSSGTGDTTTAERRKFNYNPGADPHAEKQDAAKIIISGESWGDCAGAKRGDGCGDIPTSEQLQLNFPAQHEGTLTVVIDAFWPSEWKANGGGTGHPDCGGQLGNFQRWKHLRLDSTAGWMSSMTKVDFDQALGDRYFRYNEADTTGWWGCDDNVIAVLGGGGGSIGKAKVTSDSVVASTAIGVEQNDPAFMPGGKGSFWTYQGKDYPIYASTWTRIIGHFELRVPSDDTRFDDWREECDPSGDPKLITTSSVAASTTITTLNVHGLSPGNTVLIANHQGGSPSLNGFHTVVSTPTTKTFTIAVTTTVAGSGGIVTKQTTTATDSLCAAMLSAIPDPDADSLWTLHSLWVCDETRPCQRINWRVPWYTQNESGTFMDPQQFRIELDGSASGCGANCGDKVHYVRNVLIIQNIDPLDIADTGCPAACEADSGAASSKIHRKPVR